MKLRKNFVMYMLGFLAVAMLTDHLNAQEEAESAQIRGQLVDEEDNPIAGVVIKAFETKDVAISDQEGNFTVTTSPLVDHLTIDEPGFRLLILPVSNGSLDEPVIRLSGKRTFDKLNSVEVPYRTVPSAKSVGSIYTLSGEELESYSTVSFMDALSGILPGVYINSITSLPGQEYNSVTVRGENALIYVDGVIRDPSDLSAEEVERVDVIRDLPGRAMMGIYGSSPVIWITTKKGESYHREVKAVMEFGAGMPTTLPRYADAADYAVMYNEALVNDGYDPFYSNEAIEAYRTGSDPVHYPNIDYTDDYLRNAAPYRLGNITFSGGDQAVNYFSMFSYAGSSGLEGMGETYNSNRYKVRGNVNIRLTNALQLNVNISGTYRRGRSPNSNVFTTINSLPANAHPIYFEDKLIISNDYPVNIENNLRFSGFNEDSYLATQNTASLIADLSDLTEGLTARAAVAFDAASVIDNVAYETAALYRLVTTPSGADSTELVVQEVVATNLSLGSNSIMRKTVMNGSLNYNRDFGKQTVVADLNYYQATFQENYYQGYQPELIQDLSLRTGYTYDDRYTLYLEQVLSGSMRMPEGDRFAWFPTVGASWVISEESFLGESSAIDFLKLNASFGIIGVNDFGLSGYNSYYLYQTLFEQGGAYRSGIPGYVGTGVVSYQISQAGSDEYSIPKKQYMNFGIQGSAWENSLVFGLDYYRMKEYDVISQKESYTPSLLGGGPFLPATNFGENLYYGLDGMLQYNLKAGDFGLSIGVNALYHRGKYVVVDEPLNQEEYRKLAGKNMDEYFVYHAEGLFQSQEEIDDREVKQSFGELKPGDIRYTDYNEDGVVDEKDVYSSGAHSPRIYLGANILVTYRGIGMKIVAQGMTDGEILLLNDYIVTTGSSPNYTEVMLDRWPQTNDMPRLTTSSENNVQTSTFWLRDASYLRVKNIELSYTFPAVTSRKIMVNRLKLFVRGTNLLTFSNLMDLGIDPEFAGAGINIYPIYKTVTGGVSLSF